LNSPPPSFGADPLDRTRSRPRVLWKRSLAVSAALLVLVTWRGASGILYGRSLANVAVRHFHEQLNGGQYEKICQEADARFAPEDKHQEVVKFLEAVHRRLGQASSEELTSLTVIQEIRRYLRIQ